VPSIALGTQEVNLLELTSAYAPFGNGGMGVIPNVITRIESKDGKVLYEASNAGPGRVIAPNILAEMNDMLKTAVEVGTGKGANLNGWSFGGKTGTSQESKDALFVGYTARMVTGVWLGNDDNTKTTLSGGNVPAAIWSQFMTKAHEGLPVTQIPGGAPDAATSQPVAQTVFDPATGQPAIDPATGQPLVQYVDPTTGQPVDGYAAAAAPSDPATGLPPDVSQNAQTGAPIDPATGLRTGVIIDASGQQIDPATGYPVGQVAPSADSAPIDPETGMPMQLVVDPATGQQVWVPSQPLQAPTQQWEQPQGQFAPPEPVETFAPPQPVEAQPSYQGERQQRTLMDIIFGD
jgi:penicillin-binding protein 1A